MKYVNPDNPKEIWEAKGRGRPPKWVTEMKRKMEGKGRKILSKKGRKLVSEKEVKIKKIREGEDDPLVPAGTVLTNGTFRVNGKMTYLSEDFFLYLDEGDRVAKVF